MVTLREFLESKGALDASGVKCSCPFHRDRHPSAYVNSDSIYCFTCGRSYSLNDFKIFGVTLDRENESNILSDIKGKELKGKGKDSVMFSFPWY